MNVLSGVKSARQFHHFGFQVRKVVDQSRNRDALDFAKHGDVAAVHWADRYALTEFRLNSLLPRFAWDLFRNSCQDSLTSANVSQQRPSCGGERDGCLRSHIRKPCRLWSHALEQEAGSLRIQNLKI